MNHFNAYAATFAKGPLKPFSFDPGALGSEEVEIKVSYCGVCHSDLSMLDIVRVMIAPFRIPDVGYVPSSFGAGKAHMTLHLDKWGS